MQSEYTTRKTLFKNKKITILLEKKQLLPAFSPTSGRPLITWNLHESIRTKKLFWDHKFFSIKMQNSFCGRLLVQHGVTLNLENELELLFTGWVDFINLINFF